MRINLFDAAFSHNACSVHGKVSKHIEYVRSRLRWDGVTLITDAMLCDSRVLDVLESTVKIGWLLEPREYVPGYYAMAPSLLPKLDLLLTHDAELLRRFPDKCRFVPFGGSWIQELGIRPKSKDVSMIYSGKRFMEGHRLRHQIAETVPGIDLYGLGSANPLEIKEPGLVDYRFSIAIENSRAENYFTEKLLDCFATGTIPIYWGCPNIHEFFNTNGIVQIQSAADLADFLAAKKSGETCEYEYEAYLDAAADNLERMRQYEITEDYLYLHILKDFEA